MTHSPNVTEAGLNGLLDHAKAQAAVIAELELFIWYATDVLLEADAIFRRYGLPHVPGDEVRGLLDAVKDYLLRCPVIDADVHNHPLPERPQTPGVVEEGEASATPGPNVDIAFEDDISGAFADLNVTDEMDGDAA